MWPFPKNPNESSELAKAFQSQRALEDRFRHPSPSATRPYVQPRDYDYDTLKGEIDNFVATIQERYGITHFICFWAQSQGNDYNDGYLKKGDEHYLYGLLSRWTERIRQSWRNEENDKD